MGRGHKKVPGAVLFRPWIQIEKIVPGGFLPLARCAFLMLPISLVPHYTLQLLCVLFRLSGALPGCVCRRP